MEDPPLRLPSGPYSAPLVTLATFDRGHFVDPARNVNAITIREFRGRRYVDLRRLFRDPMGKMIATGRGFTIRAIELAQVIAALVKAKAILDGTEPLPSPEASP